MCEQPAGWLWFPTNSEDTFDKDSGHLPDLITVLLWYVLGHLQKVGMFMTKEHIPPPSTSSSSPTFLKIENSTCSKARIGPEYLILERDVTCR